MLYIPLNPPFGKLRTGLSKGDLLQQKNQYICCLWKLILKSQSSRRPGIPPNKIPLRRGTQGDVIVPFPANVSNKSLREAVAECRFRMPLSACPLSRVFQNGQKASKCHPERIPACREERLILFETYSSSSLESGLWIRVNSGLLLTPSSYQIP